MDPSTRPSCESRLHALGNTTGDRRRCAVWQRRGRGMTKGIYVDQPLLVGRDSTTHISSSSRAGRCRLCLIRCRTSACSRAGFLRSAHHVLRARRAHIMLFRRHPKSPKPSFSLSPIVVACAGAVRRFVHRIRLLRCLEKSQTPVPSRTPIDLPTSNLPLNAAPSTTPGHSPR